MNPETVHVQPLTVCRYGDPVLRKKSEKVEEITPEIRAFADRMIDSMYRNNGIGLAAAQVGYNIRLITLSTLPAENPLPPDASPGELLLASRMPLALVNPEIVSASDQRESAEEGCLSLPGLYGPVERPESVVLKTTLLSGESMTIECGHLLARCLQHEIDHMDGVLFVDRMTEDDYLPLAGDLRQLKKQTRRDLKKQRK